MIRQGQMIRIHLNCTLVFKNPQSPIITPRLIYPVISHYSEDIHSPSYSTLHQPRLRLIPLLLLDILNFLPRTIKPSIGLIERILGTPLKLLANQLYPLILP